jgi:multidrug efflux pump subunit AcrA (membrane-fusion protein)
VIIVVLVALAGVGTAIGVTDPFASGRPSRPVAADLGGTTALAAVTRQDLSSQTQVAANLGYAGSYDVVIPSGSSVQAVAQAQQTVIQDQQTLIGDEQVESDVNNGDSRAIAAAQTVFNAGRPALAADQATESEACAGSGASSAACSQDAQKISQDQTQITQAQAQLDTTQSTATLDHDQGRAKIAGDQTKLAGDQASLASLQATETNPGTTYTWLPQAGQIIKEDQPVCSLTNEPVLLLYGSIPASRAFYVGMSDGADVGELTSDLIALGYGDGLTQSDHYSTASASAVQRWQAAMGLAPTGEILLGQIVVEPGPIRVTSVTASLGQTLGGGSGANPGGGGGVLSATSTARQVSIALDTAQQSEVAVGDHVTITLPNNQVTPGVISSVGSVATTPSSSGLNGSGSSNPTITVLVNPTDPAETGTWDEAPVNVTVTTTSVSNALVVPVDALLAQTGGGYAVEVVDSDGIHRLMAVSLGLFDDADGLVQITGSNLAVGQRVTVPNV